MPTKKWKWRCWQCSTLRNSGGVDDWRAAAARCKSTDVKDWFCKNTCKPKAAPIGLPPPEGWQGEPEDWEGKRKSAWHPLWFPSLHPLSAGPNSGNKIHPFIE